ncbi:MAG TPA: hypothetical protein VFM41_06480 [Gaiella sp.]|jgi:hypothetical protein|nr:hypothetical protein [Gaiella sp.]
MSILFAIILGVIGIVVLFVIPWIGAAVLGAAVILALIAVFWGGARAATGEAAEEREEPERPHMRGPSS